MKFHRFPLLLASLASLSSLLADSPDAVVTFQEIYYHDPSDPQLEWVELYNAMAVPIDLSGWALADGIQFTFPRGSSIAAGQSVVVARQPSHPRLNAAGQVFGPYTGALANEGETVDLLSSSGRLMDRVTYSDVEPWPAAADGAGFSLVKRRPLLPADNPAHWTASSQPGGTPGSPLPAHPEQNIVQTLIPQGASWKYSTSTASPPSSWNAPEFDDSSWASGPAPIASEPFSSDLPDIPLVSRYSAADIPSASPGSVISQWPDLVSTDGFFQHAAPGGNPTFIAGATPSGLPAVRFDGDDECRTSTSPGIGSQSGFAIFMVCKADVAPISGSIQDGSGDYLLDRNVISDNPLASLKAVNGRYGFQKRFNNGNGLGGPVSLTPISTSQFQIVTLRRNRSQNRFEIWVDGQLEGTSSDPGSSLTLQPLVIGRHGTLSQGGFRGQIAEVLVYPGELSNEQLLDVGSYLSSRYQLTTSFPDANASTLLPPGEEAALIRRGFDFNGNPSRTRLFLHSRVADGAAIYLNGQEAARLNLPSGPITPSTPASSDPADPVESVTEIDTTHLRPGANTLAVSLHPASGSGSTFFSASLSSEEEWTDPDAPPHLAFHEIAPAGAAEFFIELHNPGSAPVSSDRIELACFGAVSASLPLPVATIPPSGTLLLSESTLGFRPAVGDRLVLRHDSGYLIDSRAADSRLRGISPDYPREWLYPLSPTPGAANAFNLTHEIVLNEIAYHPPRISAASENFGFVELHNRGNTTISLAGWQLSDGIRYTFPPNASLAPGAFLTVARHPATLAPHSPSPVLGPFSGNLSRQGETITLLDASGNPADRVSYLDGGRWPSAADGRGSSLELRHPGSDNRLPESWAPSIESSRRSWQQVTYRRTAAASAVGPDSQWREFIFGLLDDGEILIDDISVVESPDTAPVQMIGNGNFSQGLQGWRCLGNHRHASIVDDPEQPGNPVLRLRSKGATEHMHNHVETTLANNRSVTNGRTYEISYRVRWISGSHRLNTRLYFNRCAQTTPLNRTDLVGTPGSPNSTLVPSAPPEFTEFLHQPAVPSPADSPVIRTRVRHPQGLASVTLHYSVAGASFLTVPMTYDSASDTYSAALPPQSAATVVRFYVSAASLANPSDTVFFPAAGPESHALYQVDDSLAASNGLHNLRLIMDPADKELLYRPNNVMSNERLGCTVIYNESEIFYNCGIRLKSSQRGRLSDQRVGFNIRFPDERKFRGIHSTVSIDRSEGQITGCQEILYDHTMAAAGNIPAEYNDLCRVIAPNPAHTSQAILQMARYNDVFLDSQFPDGGSFPAWEYELVYYPTTTDANGFKLPQPDLVVGTQLRDLGDDPENYRWTFLQENRQEADDSSRIIAMARHFSKTGSDFENGLGNVIDPEQWILSLAHACTTGAGDSFFDNANHNGIFYARPDGRVLYFPHDMDFSFQANRNIFQSQNLQKLIANPSRKRLYLSTLYRLCHSVFNASYLGPWAQAYGSLLPGEDFTGHLNYIQTRSDYILSAIQSDTPSLAFEITTNQGNPFSTGTSPATLQGNAWVNVAFIRLSGSSQPLPLAWNSTTQWQTSIPLQPGINQISLEAVDFEGNVVGSDQIIITQTGNIRLPSSSTLVVSEIYYNPPGNDELTEFIELLNISSFTLDLSQVSVEDAISYTIPPSTLLSPGQRLVIARDPSLLAEYYEIPGPLVGPFPGNLSNSGATVTLRSASGQILHQFAYSDSPPWPVEADGDGYSLVLVHPDSAPDHNLVTSWRASLNADGGTPGTDDSESFASWLSQYPGLQENDDPDGDGLDSLLEFLFGGDPYLHEPHLQPSTQLQEDGSFLLGIRRRVSANHPAFSLETSENLQIWTTAPSSSFQGSERFNDVVPYDILTWRFTPPPSSTRHFTRFRLAP